PSTPVASARASTLSRSPASTSTRQAKKTCAATIMPAEGRTATSADRTRVTPSRLSRPHATILGLMHTPTVSAPPAPAESAAPPPSLERGACLGSYQLVLPIASGGMGRVWIAAKRGDFGFERMFAVKVMREDLAERASFRRMFLDEAKLAARVRHTN